MKQDINVFDYSTEILKALQTGILLTTKADGKVNTMTIAWGTLGIEWIKPIFTAFIRENRFTKELLEKNPEFTINIPYGDFAKNILGVSGTKSGRDTDKIAELELTLEPTSYIRRRPYTFLSTGCTQFFLWSKQRLSRSLLW